MPTAPQTTTDPLHAFIAGAFVSGTPRPCPLIATRFDAIIDAGLAVVTMRRTFRNAEPASIEATMTFPVPVQATLFALDVRLGERVLNARAQRKSAAREHYEQALERGKTAVLHEEVLRGVHMLSIGPIAPQAELEVRATWAMTLTNAEGCGRLRIPLTVGDIYGRSGLSDSDDLIHGGLLQHGTLTVDCRDGTASLLGGHLVDRRAEIPLNAPIEVDVAGWTPRELHGRAADGRNVALRIAPCAGSDAALDAAIVVDHSGSMEGRCSMLPAGGLTKHAAVIAALAALDRQIGGADLIDLWEFDDKLAHVGSTRETPLRNLVQRLTRPNGGTEVGRALDGVIAGSAARDLLLLTDGKSHALDVQALARSGRRFSVVLVGSDSLEANVGHLAALTGGELFAAAGPDLNVMLEAATRSLRVPYAPARREGDGMRERRGGMELAVNWERAGDAAEPSLEARAVAALAASLLLPTLTEDAAAALAEAEGLVTHLTSLVMVDEEAAAQQGIPGTRKIALPTPDTVVFNDLSGITRAFAAAPVKPSVEEERAMRASSAIARKRFAAEEAPARRRSRLSPLSALRGFMRGEEPPRRLRPDFAALAARIDWDLAPQQLQQGDLSSLEPEVAQTIRDLAQSPLCRHSADEFACEPVMLIIALLARTAARHSRAAKRIARAILGDRPTSELEAAIARTFPSAMARMEG